MAQREFLISDAPKPGEPLEIDIHPENKRILDDDIRDRIERQKAKLKPLVKRRLERRYKKLHKKLRHANYNQLVIQREGLWNEYQKMLYAVKRTDSKPTAAMKAKYKSLKTAFNEIQKNINALDPLINEFDDVNNALKSHQEIMDLEREDKENFEAFKREARTWEQQIMSVFRQSPALHHKGENSKGKPFINTPTIDNIHIKEDKIYYRIKTSSQTALERFFGRWHSALPYGVNVADLTDERTIENLSTACNRVIAVERSTRGRNLYYVVNRFDSPDGIPRKVLYQNTIDWYPVKDHSKTPWPAGVGDDRKIIWYDFETYPHMLIAGATQGGKSNLVNEIIASIASMNTPEEVRFILADMKGGIEFTHWKDLKHQIGEMATTPNDFIVNLKKAHKVMEHRLEMFEAMKAKNLATFNEKAKKKIPRIIIVIDEMATLIGLGEMTSDIHNELRVLSAQGRAVGIHLLLCTQHSSVDVIPGWVKTNMGLRISSKMPTAQSSMVILDTITAATLPNLPGRMVFSAGRDEIVVQSPFISDSEIAKVVRISSDYDDPDDSEFEAQSAPMPIKKFSRDDIFRYAIEEFNGKLSASRIHDEVGNDVITLRKLRAMVNRVKDQIERDGCIEWRDKTYSLDRDRKSYVLVEIVKPDTPHAPDEQPSEQSRTPIHVLLSSNKELSQTE